MTAMLVELVSRNEAKASTPHERMTFYAELRSIAEDRGYTQGWAANQYRAKFMAFPPWAWNDHPTRTPSATTRSWVRSRQIAYAKRRAA